MVRSLLEPDSADTRAGDADAGALGGLPAAEGAALAVTAPDARAQNAPRAAADPARAPQTPLPEVEMRDGVAEARIEPDELGGIDIRVSREEGGLSVTIRAERPESAALMRRHADLLQRELAEGGVGKARIDFGSTPPPTPGAGLAQAGLAPMPDAALPAGGTANAGGGQPASAQGGGLSDNSAGPGGNSGGQPGGNGRSGRTPAGPADTGPAGLAARSRADTPQRPAPRGIDIRF